MTMEQFCSYKFCPKQVVAGMFLLWGASELLSPSSTGSILYHKERYMQATVSVKIMARCMGNSKILLVHLTIRTFFIYFFYFLVLAVLGNTPNQYLYPQHPHYAQHRAGSQCLIYGKLAVFTLLSVKHDTET